MHIVDIPANGRTIDAAMHTPSTPVARPLRTPGVLDGAGVLENADGSKTYGRWMKGNRTGTRVVIVP